MGVIRKEERSFWHELSLPRDSQTGKTKIQHSSETILPLEFHQTHTHTHTKKTTDLGHSHFPPILRTDNSSHGQCEKVTGNGKNCQIVQELPEKHTWQQHRSIKTLTMKWMTIHLRMGRTHIVVTRLPALKACRCYTAVHLVGLGNNILTMAVLFDCGMRNKQLMATAGQAKALWQR